MSWVVELLFEDYKLCKKHFRLKKESVSVYWEIFDWLIDWLMGEKNFVQKFIPLRNKYWRIVKVVLYSAMWQLWEIGNDA